MNLLSMKLFARSAAQEIPRPSPAVEPDPSVPARRIDADSSGVIRIERPTPMHAIRTSDSSFRW